MAVINSFVFLASVMLVTGVLAVDIETLQKYADKCREGTTVTKEMVVTLLHSNMDMAKPDYATKCYFKCLLESTGLMKPDGSIELDADHAHFKECANKATEDDLCDRVYHFNCCIHKQFPELPIV